VRSSRLAHARAKGWSNQPRSTAEARDPNNGPQGWHPAYTESRVGVTPERAGAFVAARLSIINDSTASAGDRLRAMEQLESRALGKPKETLEHQDGKTEVDRAMDEMSIEDLEALVQQGRHLRAVEQAAAANETAEVDD
jgi:hypothetical protein